MLEWSAPPEAMKNTTAQPERSLRSVAAIAASCVFGLLLATLSGAVVDDPGDVRLEPQRRFEALLERMRERQGELQSLSADFVQRRESEMLLEPEVANGTFQFSAPDRVRWEFVEPDPISLVIDGEAMTTWYRDLEKAERMAIGGQSQRVLRYLGASSSIDELLEYFNVHVFFPEEAGDGADGSGGRYRLDLDPRYKRLEKRLRAMSVWVDPELFLPVRLRYEDGSGDVTEYRFENFVLNGDVDSDRFQLPIPEEVEIRQVEFGRAGR